MSRRTKPSSNSRADAAAGPRLAGWKLWRLRLLAALALPLALLALIEIVLRLAGFGHPTAFLLASSNRGEKTFVQNNQFGWRFFGRQMSRTPYPISIAQTKPPGTIRLFVFGESAAYGDPQPRFGLCRMLQTLLSLRFPDARFEVVNAAMTGINSHVIVPIARDCARAGGDIWVVYMGNNEVVGPFGAGTVFGPHVPPLPLIHASLAIKATRTGQWLDSLLGRMQKPPPEKSEWGGMMMFLDQQVAADDPRMAAVYHHFEKNLGAIIRAGRNSGAGVVVSTVAVNLKDCAPFASAHRANLSDADKAKWEQLYAAGVAAQAAGKMPDAAAQFQSAAAIDDRVAELRFRQSQCALALGNLPEAQAGFSAARDLDTLRFRCDNRLNDLIRRDAAGRASEGVRCADAERELSAASADGLPGADFFYEHVHPTFEGNYLIARAIAGQAEKFLPDRITARAGADRPWPSPAECAQRLARTDQDLRSVLSDVLTRLSDPPFTTQLDHAAQVRRLTARMQELVPADPVAAAREAEQICTAALAANPADPELLEQLASLKSAAGDLPGAASAAGRAADLLPSNAGIWSQLGLVFAQQQKFEEAAAAFRRAFALDPENVWALQNLALSLNRLNRRDEAEREYRRALAIKPRFGPAWLGLGQLLEAAGRKGEAEECFQKALANRIHRAADLTTLARFCVGRGWREAAATNYSDAIRLDPTDTALHMESAQNFAALGRHNDAMLAYAEAVRLAPGLMQAHYLYGTELGRADRPAEAVEQFREAVRLAPDLVEARLNLGIALSKQARWTEALAEFEEALKRSPTNALALQYRRALLEKTSGTVP